MVKVKKEWDEPHYWVNLAHEAEEHFEGMRGSRISHNIQDRANLLNAYAAMVQAIALTDIADSLRLQTENK